MNSRHVLILISIVLLIALCKAVPVSSPPKSYYDVLGVQRTASIDEIKAKYRKMARKFHPDKVNGDEKVKEKANARFMEIAEAAETLTDDGKRKDYDAGLDMGFTRPQAGAPQGAGQPWGAGSQFTNNPNVKVHVHTFKSGGEDIDRSQFSNMFGFDGFGGFGSDPNKFEYIRSKRQNEQSSSPKGRRPNPPRPEAPQTSKTSKPSHVPTSTSSRKPRPSSSCKLKCEGPKCSRVC